MTANRRQVQTVIAVVLGLFIVGVLSSFGTFGSGLFGAQGLVGLIALLPVFLVTGLVWFGREVFMSLHRIEAAVDSNSGIEREFSHGS